MGELESLLQESCLHLKKLHSSFQLFLKEPLKEAST